MVLAYLGIRISYTRLVQMLGIGAYGTPGRNLLRLAALGVRVNYGPSSFTELTEHLKDENPCIALVRTRSFPIGRMPQTTRLSSSVSTMSLSM